MIRKKTCVAAWSQRDELLFTNLGVVAIVVGKRQLQPVLV